VIEAKGDSAGFRETCIAGAKTIPAYLAFLGICYLAAGRTDDRIAIGSGLAAWLVVALGIFLAPLKP
jgi:uncharacterized membrane protein (GlpM family)